jgi:hypothetical protein
MFSVFACKKAPACARFAGLQVSTSRSNRRRARSKSHSSSERKQFDVPVQCICGIVKNKNFFRWGICVKVYTSLFRKLFAIVTLFEAASCGGFDGERECESISRTLSSCINDPNVVLARVDFCVEQVEKSKDNCKIATTSLDSCLSGETCMGDNYAVFERCNEKFQVWRTECGFRDSEIVEFIP